MSLALVREPGRKYYAPLNKHDTGYKYLLSNEAIFLQLLRSFVREKWVQDIDEESIIRMPNSFILPDFRHQEADLVYRLRSGNQDIFFFLLLELQSTVDVTMPFRLLMYMVEIWHNYWFNLRRHRTENGFRLPVIVPCVLYNGKSRWTAKGSFGECQQGFGRFKDCALDFKYIVIDVNRLDKRELLGMGNLLGSVFYMDQRKEVQALLQGLRDVAPILGRLPTLEEERFFNWFGKIALKGMSSADTNLILDTIREERGDTMITNVERILQETWQKHRSEGIEEDMLRGREEGKRLVAINLLRIGQQPELVARISELTMEEVMELKETSELGKL